MEETSSPASASGAGSNAAHDAPSAASGSAMQEEPSAPPFTASAAQAPSATSHGGLPDPATAHAGSAAKRMENPTGADRGDMLSQLHRLAIEVPGILGLANFVRRSISAEDSAYFDTLDTETLASVLRNAVESLTSMLTPASLGGGAGSGTATLAGACGGEFLQGAATSLLRLARDAHNGGAVGLIPGLSRLHIEAMLHTGAGFGVESNGGMGGDDDGMELPPLEVDGDLGKEERAARRAVTAESLAAEASVRARVKSDQHARLLESLGTGHLCDDCGRLPPFIVCLCTASYSRRCPICDFDVHFFRGGGRLCQRTCGLELTGCTVTGLGNSVALPLKSNEVCCLYDTTLPRPPSNILEPSGNAPGHTAGQHLSSTDFEVIVRGRGGGCFCDFFSCLHLSNVSHPFLLFIHSTSRPLVITVPWHHLPRLHAVVLHLI